MNLEGLVEEMFRDDAKVPAITRDIGMAVSRKEYKLASVVDVLGPHLTSKETLDRTKGMAIFSYVLNHVEDGVLTGDELGYVVEFLHDRLKDQHMVLPKVIHSIQSIISNSNLPQGAAAKLLMQLFKEANIQSHIHKDRHAFFLTMAYVVERKLGEIKEWGSDFIMFFIQSMDGEKDPRNLLLLFRLVPTILANFPMGALVEDMFEVLSCYFPVDFQPIKSADADGLVTREDLAKSLHGSLSITRKFAPFLIPLVLEKLESSVVSAKLDSIDLLKKCCASCYTAADLEPHFPALWRICRSEVFMGSNESVNEAIFSLISSIFRVLPESPSCMEQCLLKIFAECKHHLMEPEMRLMQPASAILYAIIEGSETSARLMLSKLLPVLLEQFLSMPSLSEKLSLLMLINEVVQTAKKSWRVRVIKVTSNGDELLATIFGLLPSENTGLKDLGLRFFTLVCGELDEDAVNTLLLHLVTIIQAETSFPPLSTQKNLFECLEILAISHPSQFEQNMLKRLIAFLKCDGISDEKKEFLLRAMSECCYFGSSMEVIVSVLLEEIRTINECLARALSCLDSEVEHTVHLQSLELVVKSFLRLVQKGAALDSKYIHLAHGKEQNLSRESFSRQFCDFILSKNSFVDFVKCATSSRRVYSGAKQSHIITKDLAKAAYLTVTEIIRILLRTSSIGIQQTVVEMFCNVKDDSLLLQAIEQTPRLLTASVLGSVLPAVKIPYRNTLMEILLQQSCNDLKFSKDDELAEFDAVAEAKLYAAMLNKADNATFPTHLENLDRILSSVVATNSCNDSTVSRRRSCFLIILSLKAIAIRGAPEFEQWLSKILDLLNDIEIGSFVAENFEILVEDCDILLNPQAHCFYRFLYKQRLFLSSVPKLVKVYKASPPDDIRRVNYIRALSCQLKHVPNTVLSMELTNILPLLVASLNCDASSAPVRLSSLKALQSLIKDQSQKVQVSTGDCVLQEYYHDIVPNLLRLTQYQGSLEVRALALHCLQKCARFPSHMVVQEKPQVVDILRNVLDDPKRLVRREAVIARNLWILVGAPGGL